MTDVAERPPTSQLHPLAIGLLSFATTIAFILAQPGVALA